MNLVSTGNTSLVESPMITSKVLDHHGQIKAHITCIKNGIWFIHPKDNSNTFTVNFSDPSFRRDILASQRPWVHPDWNTVFRINVLLELLHWVGF